MSSILFSGVAAQASFDFPQNLDKNDRIQVMETFGLSTAGKFLSPAFPLGGHSGLEVSMTIESFDVEPISQLGSGADNRDQIVYPKINVGKGLFHNLDLFFEFVPYSESSKTSRYGMQIRWGFYEARSLPFIATLGVHANSANLSNKLTTRTLGADLMFGAMFGMFSFHMGGGLVQSTGRFAGGSQGVTDSLVRESESLSHAHWSIGTSFLYQIYLLGLGVDYYKHPVYSLKLGFIF